MQLFVVLCKICHRRSPTGRNIDLPTHFGRHYGGNEYGLAGSGSFCDQPHLTAGALQQLSERFFP